MSMWLCCFLLSKVSVVASCFYEHQVFLISCCWMCCYSTCTGPNCVNATLHVHVKWSIFVMFPCPLNLVLIVYVLCMLVATMIPLTWASYHLSHDSNDQRSERCNGELFLSLSLFMYIYSLQESLRGRPKEIPHNEKLLSLKYEVNRTQVIIR